MEDYRFFGAYATFIPEDKSHGELLQTADFPIGTDLNIEFRTTRGYQIAWLRNKYGKDVGALDADISRTLSIITARGWTIHAILNFVAYSDEPEPGQYWGQVALIAYDKALDQVFSPWTANIAEKIQSGVRPDISLSPAQVDRVIESGGTWLPSARVPKPEGQGRTAIVKDHLTFSEKIVELGRQRKPGCMVAGWIFNILVVAGLVALILHWCGVY